MSINVHHYPHLSLDDFEAERDSLEEIEHDGYYVGLYEIFDDDDSDVATEYITVVADSERELDAFFEENVSGHDYQSHLS